MTKKKPKLSAREIERRRKQAAEAADADTKLGDRAEEPGGGKPPMPTKAKEFRHQGR